MLSFPFGLHTSSPLHTPAALSLPEHELAANTAVTTQLLAKPSPGASTPCLLPHPKGTLQIPMSVTSTEISPLFNDCLSPGVSPQLLCWNAQTAATKHHWVFLGMLMT